MGLDLDDTIAAIASPPGPAVRGIIRVSGPETLACLSRVAGRPPGGFHGCVEGAPEPGSLGPFANLHRRGSAGSLSLWLDLGPRIGPVQVECCVWPTTRSYTRQPSAELHCLGAPPLLEAILWQLCESGARLARPGEFTLRAFLAGRLDLMQAEAVLGVIEAPTRSRLQTALQQLAGGLSHPLERLREALLTVLADLEAGLDFVEEDLEFISRDELVERLEQGREQLEAVSHQLAQRGGRDEQLSVVLRGPPNAGKSSLLNALCGQDAALVSPQAGTTRDFVQRTVTLQGLTLRLVDTAGVELPGAGEAGCSGVTVAGELDELAEEARIAAASQHAAAEQHRRAMLELYCIDGTRPLADWQQEELARPSSTRLLVLTKADLPGHADLKDQLAAIISCGSTAPDLVATSSATGAGLETLRHQLVARVGHRVADELVSTSLRCRASLDRAGEALQAACQAARDGLGEELVSLELRLALDALGEVTGQVYTDDVLDLVFSRFCIGK